MGFCLYQYRLICIYFLDGGAKRVGGTVMGEGSGKINLVWTTKGPMSRQGMFLVKRHPEPQGLLSD